MNIRTFTMDDYDAARVLWESMPDAIGLGRSDTRDEIAKKFMHDPELFLVAEDDDKIIGTIIGGFDGRCGMIYHLAVGVPFRNRGLGRALMDEIERRLAAKGCLRAYLVVKRENVAVLDFYERIGWQPMPVVLAGKNLQ